MTNGHVVAGEGASYVVVKTKHGEERTISSVSRIDLNVDLTAFKFSGPVPAHLTLHPLEPPAWLEKTVWDLCDRSLRAMSVAFVSSKAGKLFKRQPRLLTETAAVYWSMGLRALSAS